MSSICIPCMDNIWLDIGDNPIKRAKVNKINNILAIVKFPVGSSKIVIQFDSLKKPLTHL